MGIRGTGDRRRRAAPPRRPVGRAVRDRGRPIVDAPTLDALDLRGAPRRSRRTALADWCSTSTGRPGGPHLRQVVPRRRARPSHGDLPEPARRRRVPADRGRRRRTCSTGARAAGVAAIPYGGGSSVVGGVECAVGDDVRRRGVDRPRARSTRSSRSTARRAPARIQAGALGPALEDAAPAARATRCATSRSRSSSRRSAAGWRPARAATTPRVYTHIDDLVESMRVVTPTGISESRRLPGSGAGPSPDRLFLGSEGTLGIITEAWMRLQDRPRWRASAGRRFGDYADGVEAAARDRPVRRCSRPTAGCSTAARRRSPAGATRHGGAARARLRVGRPSRRRRGSTAPWSCAATTAATCPGGVTTSDAPTSSVRRTQRRRRRRVAHGVPAGAVPRATRWSAAA